MPVSNQYKMVMRHIYDSPVYMHKFNNHLNRNVIIILSQKHLDKK